MTLKLASPIARHGKKPIKADPSRDTEFTRTHFGLDQTIDVTGGPEAVKTIPGSV